MKRTICFLFLSGIIGTAAALDFGINLSTMTGIGGTKKTVEVSHSDTAEIYLDIPTGAFSSVYLSGEARFYGDFLCKPHGKPQYLPISQAFRLSRTDWTGYTAVNGIGIQWALGRTTFEEYSKKILYGLFDGARIGFIFKHAQLFFNAGYTGLTYKTDAKIRIDSDDEKRMVMSDKILAPQRVFFSISSTFSELIPSHTFGIEIVTQFDLLRKKTATHTQYIIPYIHGKLHSNIGWKLWGAVLFGESTTFFYSAASGFSLYYFNPRYLNLMVNGTLDWAAGDYDGTGTMRAFIPVTDLRHTRIAKTYFRDTVTAGLSASIRPISGLVTGMSYTLLTNPNTKKTAVYTGSEIVTKLSYGFHNDFTLSLYGGVFVPNKKIETVRALQWLTELAFTVRL